LCPFGTSLLPREIRSKQSPVRVPARSQATPECHLAVDAPPPPRQPDLSRCQPLTLSPLSPLLSHPST
jgi:hypothetical protein